MANKRNQKKKKCKRNLTKILSNQPVRPMPGAKIKSTYFNAQDSHDHKEWLKERDLSKWQRSLLDKKVIARNWRSKDGKFHPDIRNEF